MGKVLDKFEIVLYPGDTLIFTDHLETLSKDMENININDEQA